MNQKAASYLDKETKPADHHLLSESPLLVPNLMRHHLIHLPAVYKEADRTLLLCHKVVGFWPEPTSATPGEFENLGFLLLGLNSNPAFVFSLLQELPLTLCLLPYSASLLPRFPSDYVCSDPLKPDSVLPPDWSLKASLLIPGTLDFLYWRVILAQFSENLFVLKPNWSLLYNIQAFKQRDHTIKVQGRFTVNETVMIHYTPSINTSSSPLHFVSMYICFWHWALTWT